MDLYKKTYKHATQIPYCVFDILALKQFNLAAFLIIHSQLDES